MTISNDAYNSGVPLTKYTATPYGAYDSFYRTRELFQQSSEINITYSRLRGYIKTYVVTIEGLLRIFLNSDHESEEIIYEYLNYTNGLWQASVEYDRELRLYESLVIRQPLQRIVNRMHIFHNFKVHRFPKTQILTDTISSYDIYDIQLNLLLSNMLFQQDAFKIYPIQFSHIGDFSPKANMPASCLTPNCLRTWE